MSTIPYLRVDEAKGLAKDVYEDIMRTYGCAEPHGIYQLMGHTPEFLAASWQRSRFLFGTQTNFSIKEKHILTLGISATNNCEYCVRIHTSRLQGLGMSAEDLIELMMVVDSVNGASKFAEGTRAGDNETIAPQSAENADARADAVLRDIKRAYGNREPDASFRLMAYLPDYLRANWERVRLCFQEDGRLGLKMKHLLAFCVAATAGNDHYIKSHGARLKELGVTDDELAEVLLVVDLTCGYNRYVQGLQAQQEHKPFGAGAEADKTLRPTR